MPLAVAAAVAAALLLVQHAAAQKQGAFAREGESCGGMMMQARSCAPGLECANSAGPMIADAPGTCSQPCPAVSGGVAQRDQWGNCIAAGCRTWFDGCNTCTSSGGRQMCTEQFCAQPTGPAECRDAAAPAGPAVVDGHDGAPCCTVQMRARGECSPSGVCCRGMTAECIACSQGCSVESYCGPGGPGYTSGICAAVSDEFAAGPADPVPDDGTMGAPEGCTTWFDGCNTCQRDGPTGRMGCTMMYCFAPAPSECRGWAVGYGKGH